MIVLAGGHQTPGTGGAHPHRIRPHRDVPPAAGQGGLLGIGGAQRPPGPGGRTAPLAHMPTLVHRHGRARCQFSCMGGSCSMPLAARTPEGINSTSTPPPGDPEAAYRYAPAPARATAGENNALGEGVVPIAGGATG